MSDLKIRRRNLPHWELSGATYFITFRLFRTLALRAPLTIAERIAVREEIISSHGEMWHLHMLTVMPDHVHILATPREEVPGRWYPLSVILRRIKGRTARAINVLRGRQGPFWQTESFDRIIRDGREYDEKAAYILNNAVKAEIVSDGWEYDGFWCSPEDSTPPQ